MLGTFEKASAVLDLYTTDTPEWGVTDVARKLGMPTSSAHVLLVSLAGMGVLHRTPAGRYRLGFRLLALSQVLLANTPWREVAQEEMKRLVQDWGDTLQLAALDGGQVVNVDKLDGRLPDSVKVAKVGAVLSAQGHVSGKILLAHRPWELAQAFLASGKKDSAKRNARTVARFAEELQQVREQGYTLDPPELPEGVGTIGVPVRNHNGEVIAALCFSVPGIRFQERGTLLREALMDACDRISVRLGFDGAYPAGGTLLWASVHGRDELRAAPHRSRSRPVPPDGPT